MNLSMGQGVAFILFGTLMVIVLLKILSIVHGQNNRVKELEMRMKAMEKIEAGQVQSETTTEEGEQTNG